MKQKEKKLIPLNYIISLFITLFKIILIVGMVVLLCYFLPFFYIFVYVIKVLCVFKIIASEDNPDYKIPWLLFVVILPIIGFLLYLMFYSRRLKKKYIKRLKYLQSKTDYSCDKDLINKLEKESPEGAGQAKTLINLSGANLFDNTKQTYFSLGDQMFENMLKDLKSAEKFIFMEYFIIKQGYFWNSILEILIEKAKLGVEIKVVYDDVGCMKTLPKNYNKKLYKYGIQVEVFSKIRGKVDNEFNNRNHRKITVIDGIIAYTGGMNIADEYINKVDRFGHWKDVGIRIEGEAVKELTKLFIIDYGLSVGEIDEERNNRYPVTNKSYATSGYLVPFGDGPRPVYQRRVGKSVICNMVSCASRYVYIMTPYLVIDNEVCQTLEDASIRGVDVKIIIPYVPDKKIVYSMTKSYCERLMKSGVKIYEYKPGFIHAKVYLVDDAYAMVGTINLDYRSLVHHFENGLWMYKTDSIVDIKKDFEQTFEKCIELSPSLNKVGILTKLFRSVVKIFAPLM